MGHALRAHLPTGSSVTSFSGALDAVLMQRPPGSTSGGGGAVSGTKTAGGKRGRSASAASGGAPLDEMMDASAGVAAFRMMEAALGEGGQIRLKGRWLPAYPFFSLAVP